MAPVVIVQSDDQPAREAGAICDRCGRRGTYARITGHTDPPEARRFCLRCWPRAYRQAIERRNAEIAAWLRPPPPSPGTTPADWLALIRSRVPPPRRTVTWHWLAAVGAHWRYIRYER